MRLHGRFVSLTDGVQLLSRLRMEGRDDRGRHRARAGQRARRRGQKDRPVCRTRDRYGCGLDPRRLFRSGLRPYDYGHFAVIYDSQTVKNPPDSLKALVEGDPAQKIVLQDPRSSTPGLGFLIWMKAVYGDKAAEAWTELNRRVLTVTPGWSEAYGLFTKGEADMVLSYSTSPAYHLIAEQSDRYKAALFAEGHPLQIEVAGMTRTADADLARRFLAFMISPAFQDIIPETNWMMPAGKTSAALNPVFDTLIKPQTIAVDPERIGAERKAWIDEWLAASGAR